MSKKKDKKEKKKWKKLLKKASSSRPPVSTVGSISKELNEPKERRSPNRMSDNHVNDIKSIVKKLHRIYVGLLALNIICMLNVVFDFNTVNLCIAILAFISNTVEAKLADKLEEKIHFKRK